MTMTRVRHRSYIATLYSVLDVSPGCSAAELAQAHRQLCALWHPDRADGGDEERYRELTLAYSQLKSPELRRAYDAQLRMLPGRCANCQGEGCVLAAPTSGGWYGVAQGGERVECQQCEGTGRQPVS